MNGRLPNIFGQGLSFPPRVDADGRLACSAGEDNVRESIRLVLLTEPGERLMLEAFGCGLRQYLLEPNTVTTRQLIRESILHALGRWEPRIAVADVTVDPDVDNPRQIGVTIFFRLVATQAQGRMNLALQLEG